MHELSIAQSIIEMVEEEAKKNHAHCITEIEIDIGLVSGVIPDTLQFAMEIAVKDTMLEHAKIFINTIPGKAKCKGCFHEFYIDELYAICPNCSSYNFDVMQGKEMQVKNFSIT